MTTRLKVAWLFTLASAALMFASVLFMGFRIARYNEANPIEFYHFVRKYERAFTLPQALGGRRVEIQDAIGDDGRPALRIVHGDNSMLIPCRAPIVKDQPDLNVYNEWLSVLATAPVADGRVSADPRTGEGARLVIVNRRVADGATPDTWGSVDVKRWVFDFIEPRPDGTLSARVMQFPAFVYNTNKTYLPAAKDDPNTTVRMIPERSWEWTAALHSVPAAQVSRYRFSTDAVSGNEKAPGMGWTLPGAGVGVLGMIFGAIVLLSAKATRPDQGGARAI